MNKNQEEILYLAGIGGAIFLAVRAMKQRKIIQPATTYSVIDNVPAYLNYNATPPGQGVYLGPNPSRVIGQQNVSGCGACDLLSGQSLLQ